MENSVFHWVALAATVFTFGLVVVGGIVRVTGSGLGCPDWPLCQGQLIPALNGPTPIDYSHRRSASLTSIFVVAITLFATFRFRSEKYIFRPSILAPVLLGVQIVLGDVTVLLELPPVIVAVHLANALMILALLLLVTIYAFRIWMAAKTSNSWLKHYRTLVWLSAIGTLA
jgi:heme A synthase